MEMHVRMLDQERAHGLRVMGREVIRDDMNVPSFRLAGDDVLEEIDKGGTRVPRHGMAQHFARLRVERGKERERAVRSYSKPWRSARPGDSGSTGSRRSSA